MTPKGFGQEESMLCLRDVASPGEGDEDPPNSSSPLGTRVRRVLRTTRHLSFREQRPGRRVQKTS